MNINLENLTLPLDQVTKRHALNVYTQLSLMLLVSSAASYLYLYGVLSFLGGTLGLVGTIGSLLVFTFTPATPQNKQLRQGLLFSFALFKGFALGPLLDMALYVNPQNVSAALVGAFLIFTSFSLSVMYAPNRMILYSTGFLASAASLLMWTSFLNMFVQSQGIFTFELYLGLLVFSLYVIYDTQTMILHAVTGRKDYLRDALVLYTDIVAIFVRLLVLLTRKEENKRKRRN